MSMAAMDNLSEEEIRQINFLKNIKSQLCDNCQKIIREQLYDIIDP